MRVVLSFFNAIFYDAFLESQTDCKIMLMIFCRSLILLGIVLFTVMWSYMFVTIRFSSVAAVISCYCLIIVAAVIVLGLGALFLLFFLLYSQRVASQSCESLRELLHDHSVLPMCNVHISKWYDGTRPIRTGFMYSVLSQWAQDKARTN